MFDSQGNFLFHSQDWRNHKYIRKEGNRYIYPEDIKTPQQASRNTGGTGGTHSGYGSGGSHADRKVVAPSAPNPARTATTATRNINSASGGGGSNPSSRAGMPSNIKKTKVLKGGQADVNSLYQTYVSRKSTRTKDGRTIQSMDHTSQGGVATAQTEMKKGLAAVERKHNNTSKSGEYAARNEIQKLINKVPKDKRRTVARSTDMSTGDYTETTKDGNGKLLSKRKGNTNRDNSNSGKSTAENEKKKGETAAKNRVNKLIPGQVYGDSSFNGLMKSNHKGSYYRNDDKGRGQAYVANEEMTRGKKSLKDKERADQYRYDEAFKNVDNVLAKLTGKSRKYEADIAEAKAKKLAKERKKDEEYLRTLPENLEISRAAEKSRIEKNKTEEEKWKVAKAISEARYKDTLHYKATKAAENVKNTAKKTAKAYDEMHEKQADALIKGKEKVKSLLKKKKKK